MYFFKNSKQLKDTEIVIILKKNSKTWKMATATKENGPGTKKTADEPKKSGTRMAINEKGLPGEKKSKQNTNNPK